MNESRTKAPASIDKNLSLYFENGLSDIKILVENIKSTILKKQKKIGKAERTEKKQKKLQKAEFFC